MVSCEYNSFFLIFHFCFEETQIWVVDTMDSQATMLRFKRVLDAKLGNKMANLKLPPPSFIDMQGELIDFHDGGEWLDARFPVLEKYQNPYGSMQGGMVAGLIDSTIGPLSMLIGQINATIKLEIVYKKPILAETKQVLIKAKLVKKNQRLITYSAQVFDDAGELYNTAEAKHWIV
jgi:uncharacterized protein (TIGR00369 family)